MDHHGLELPQATQDKLAGFRRRVRQIKIAEGILAGLFGLAISYLVVFVIDRFVDTSGVTRAAILITGSVGIAILFPLKCHRWVWGTRRMEQVAILLRQGFPALGDQLLSVVELAQSDGDGNSSRRLAEAAIEQVDSVVRDRDLSGAVPRARHRRWAAAVAVPVLLTLMAVIFVPAASRNALVRWLMPWRDVDRYTFARVESLPDSVVVPHGEEFQLATQLADNTEWSPSSGTARFDGQAATRAPLADRKYDFVVPPQTNSGDLNVRIGDLTKAVSVTVATRPELNGMTANVRLPEYLQYGRSLQSDVRGGVISLVYGSEASFQAEVSRNLATASVSAGEGVSVEANRVTTSAIPVRESQTIDFQWRDELGLSSKDAFRLKINAVDDTEPRITFRQNEEHQVILSTDVVTFELQANDDFGLQELGLEWRGVEDPVHNPSPESGEKLVTRGAPEESRLNATATFCAASDNVPPQTIELRAYTQDYKPERGRIYSPAYVLHVMTPAEHAVWMTAQLRRWAGLADDVYEEELRLHDANREIRRMSPEEINQADTRRRIEQQATAERANGKRLGVVTDQGEQLIRQAMRNPEMMVGHVETWASALQQLRNISENRMPSVADLLSEAARAPGRSAAPSSDAPSKSGPTAGNNRSSMPPGAADPAKSEGPPPNAVPKITDQESGFNKPNADEPNAEKKDSKPGAGKFGLPSTVLQGGPKSDNKKPENPAQQKADDAVVAQEDLLADFAKIREDLQNILDDLENSTFVKRLKAASRKQLEVAEGLNRTLFKGFGIDKAELDERQRELAATIAKEETSNSRNVSFIQSDLEAYFDRKQEAKFQRILEEMESTDIVRNLEELGTRVEGNLSGESISRAEFWSDTLDRWAEELVSASKCGACSGCKGSSLPPSIVLEVMRILEGEMDLREETRSVELVRDALASIEYRERAKQLHTKQCDLGLRTEQVLVDIQALPDGAAKFGKELQIISAAADAMNDAAILLEEPNTSSPTIAAETEAIELLLQSKRANPKGGGGGGGSNPGGGGTGDTDRVALELYGPGSDPNARIEHRGVNQATGSDDDGLPEEFRDGLDAFFNAIDQQN